MPKSKKKNQPAKTRRSKPVADTPFVPYEETAERIVRRVDAIPDYVDLLDDLVPNEMSVVDAYVRETFNPESQADWADQRATEVEDDAELLRVWRRMNDGYPPENPKAYANMLRRVEQRDETVLLAKGEFAYVLGIQVGLRRRGTIAVRRGGDK